MLVNNWCLDYDDNPFLLFKIRMKKIIGLAVITLLFLDFTPNISDYIDYIEACILRDCEQPNLVNYC
jgi:hypothetical protein